MPIPIPGHYCYEIFLFFFVFCVEQKKKKHVKENLRQWQIEKKNAFNARSLLIYDNGLSICLPFVIFMLKFNWKMYLLLYKQTFDFVLNYNLLNVALFCPRYHLSLLLHLYFIVSLAAPKMWLHKNTCSMWWAQKLPTDMKGNAARFSVTVIFFPLVVVGFEDKENYIWVKLLANRS